MNKFLCFFIYLLFAFGSTLHAEESVYCIHGFMRKPSSMKQMAHALQKEGYKAYSWGYPSREKNIQEHAEQLVQSLNQTAGENPEQPIHFVTHSLGGIILRAALNHPDCPKEAKQGKAVLLSPPNRGSRFGRFLHHIGPIRKFLGKKAGRQILTSQNFDYVGQFPDSVKVLVISGTFGWNPIVKEKNDGKVGVYEACLSTPHKHITVFSGHSWMMFSTSTIKETTKFISQDA